MLELFVMPRKKTLSFLVFKVQLPTVWLLSPNLELKRWEMKKWDLWKRLSPGKGFNGYVQCFRNINGSVFETKLNVVIVLGSLEEAAY